MPRVKHPCRHHPCAKLLDPGVKFCPTHQAHAPEVAYDHARGTATARGYGAAWRKRRAHHLRREPLCRECRKKGVTKAGTDVDHIVARAKGGLDIEANLQTLCHEHHSRKTNREDGGFGRPAQQGGA